MRIAFCSSEVVPFAKTGGLGDVCGALPIALERSGHEVYVFLPKYLMATGTPPLKPVTKAKGVWQTTIGKNVIVYLIEHDHFFHRPGLYGDNHGDYPDNLERFQYYCRRVLELFQELDLKIDIVHCHEWQTALIPVYLKEKFKDSRYAKIKSLLTIHNLAFQGIFPKEINGVISA